MIGTMLSNRYLITSEISMGGMGMVYRATDLRTGGDVAVKVPHAFLARNEEYMERLRREAQIAASVYSPRVVRVIDLDTHEGVPYIVMEYVPGETLADMTRRLGRFNLADTVTVGLEVARALDAAHAKGVVHRDLKPQNIKVVDGEVKVLDFGIAKGEGLAAITAASVFMGTPEYCAPERAQGEGDIRADIYALGVIMFEMHEGHIPFQATTPMALMRKHETDPPPPLTGDVPAAFQEVLDGCLAKDPAERYQTPRELVHALRALLESPSSAVARTLSPEGLAPTIRQARGVEPEVLPDTVSAPAEAPHSVEAAPPAEAPAEDGVAIVPAAAPSVAVPRPRQRLPILPIAGVLAAVLVGGTLTAVVWASRDNDGGATPTATVPAGNGTTTSGSATPQTSGLPVAPLLLPGEQKSVTGERYEFEYDPQVCPGVKTILRPTSIRQDPSGRVVVAFTIEAPRVEGVECGIDILPDADRAMMALQTRLPTGRAPEVRNTGGSGISVTGADDIYGAGPFTGEWWFDRGVNLDGDELNLLRYNPPDSPVPSIRLTLLRR